MWADIQFLGELTAARVPALLERCWATAGTPPRLIVDLTRVSMLDDQALEALMALSAEFTAAGGELRIAAGESIAGVELRDEGNVRVWHSLEDARG